MATLPSVAGAATLMDFAKSLDPNGKVASIAELLAETNAILLDMMWIEGNLPTGHRSTVRTGLPTAIWRKLYQGVPAGKSTRAQVTDNIGMLEARSEVDRALADLNGNTAAFRMSEANAFIEAMNQEKARVLFYGDSNTSDPDAFTGLTPRYNDLTVTVPNSANILDSGGTGADNTSVWLIIWGINTIFGIFPKGSKAGLSHEDLGLIDAFDGNGDRFRAYADIWKWDCGLVVADWRYAVRIANIDISDLNGATGTQALTAATNILKTMAKSLAFIPAMGKGKAAFYANRTVIANLTTMAMDKTSSVLAIEPGHNQLGKISPGSAQASVLTFLTVPIRTSDALLNTEAQVT